jgi:hypothetical protein
VRSTARLAEFGPTVAIVSVTAVVPAPAAIDAGLNWQIRSVFTHVKLTAELNAAPPTGTAENV